MSAELERLEDLLAMAFTSADPMAALAEAASDPELSPELRAAIASIDEDGARLSAILVARLRFERLIQGSREAGSWYERDARGFTRAFKRYHTSVPPTEPFPSGEARLFTEWMQRAGEGPEPDPLLGA